MLSVIVALDSKRQLKKNGPDRILKELHFGPNIIGFGVRNLLSPYEFFNEGEKNMASVICNSRILLCQHHVIGSLASLMCLRHNSNRANISRVNRNKYVLQYPTTIVLQDGSSISVRYPEPRRIIKLPIDISTLSLEEQKALRNKRRPKEKFVVTEEVEDNFDKNRYSKFWKK